MLATIPFLMAVPPIAGLLIGRFLDNRFNTNPVFTILLLVFGFVASVREVAIVLKRSNAEAEKDDHAEDDK